MLQELKKKEPLNLKENRGWGSREGLEEEMISLYYNLKKILKAVLKNCKHGNQ